MLKQKFLPIWHFVFADEFLSGNFLEASYFESIKDRTIRGLKTYFESRRADSHAVYYRDALMASNDHGIDQSLLLAQKAELDDLKDHFRVILSQPEVILECLFSGNVSVNDAKAVYQRAAESLSKAQTLTKKMTIRSSKLCLPCTFWNSFNHSDWRQAKRVDTVQDLSHFDFLVFYSCYFSRSCGTTCQPW